MTGLRFLQLSLPGLAWANLERPESQRSRDRRISVAAYAFLEARARLVGASGLELMTAAIELDDALHTLTLAAGFDAPGCYCSDCEAIRGAARPIEETEGI